MKSYTLVVLAAALVLFFQNCGTETATQKMNSFIARKYPFFADIDIMGLANTIKVHPGIIAGKLQYHTKKYNLFRKHLVPIRPILTPSAVVDGWGDVYPLED